MRVAAAVRLCVHASPRLRLVYVDLHEFREKKTFLCEGFVKENRNSKKHDLEIFWSMDFQSDLTFFLVNIF